jgi:hypothetical protein
MDETYSACLDLYELLKYKVGSTNGEWSSDPTLTVLAKSWLAHRGHLVEMGAAKSWRRASPIFLFPAVLADVGVPDSFLMRAYAVSRRRKKTI